MQYFIENIFRSLFFIVAILFIPTIIFIGMYQGDKDRKKMLYKFSLQVKESSILSKIVKNNISKYLELELDISNKEDLVEAVSTVLSDIELSDAEVKEIDSIINKSFV